MSKVFNDENVAAIGATLDNLKRASDDLPVILDQDVQTLTADTSARSTADRGGGERPCVTSPRARDPIIKAALARVHARRWTTSPATSARLDQFVAENQTNITRFSDQGLLELQQLIRESRQAARGISQPLAQLQQEPSSLIYEQKASGVEIPR